jgi:hypothetical protein
MQNQALFPLRDEMKFTSAMHHSQSHPRFSEFTSLPDAFRHNDNLLAVQTEAEVEDVNS